MILTEVPNRDYQVSRMNHADMWENDIDSLDTEEADPRQCLISLVPLVAANLDQCNLPTRNRALIDQYKFPNFQISVLQMKPIITTTPERQEALEDMDEEGSVINEATMTPRVEVSRKLTESNEPATCEDVFCEMKTVEAAFTEVGRSESATSSQPRPRKQTHSVDPGDIISS